MGRFGGSRTDGAAVLPSIEISFGCISSAGLQTPSAGHSTEHSYQVHIQVFCCSHDTHKHYKVKGPVSQAAPSRFMVLIYIPSAPCLHLQLHVSRLDISPIICCWFDEHRAPAWSYRRACSGDSTMCRLSSENAQGSHGRGRCRECWTGPSILRGM